MHELISNVCWVDLVALSSFSSSCRQSDEILNKVYCAVIALSSNSQVSKHIRAVPKAA